MTRLSIETSFTWAQRFVAREWGLLLPVALAFVGFPPLVLALLMPADLQQLLMPLAGKGIARLPAVFGWLFPLSLVILAIGGLGGLAITALALTPRMSVGEAIAHAARRLPVLVAGVALLALLMFFFALILLTVLAMTGLGLQQMQIIAVAILLVAATAFAVRMSPLMAVIVDRRIGPIDAIRETWALGRGVGWKLFLALAIYYLGALIVTFALGNALGACILAITRLGGWTDLATPLIAIVGRVLASIATAGAYVLGASFYCQLSGKTKAR